MGPTGCRWRVLQVHPTRRCNLQCLHCYSSSGPFARDELPAKTVCEAISDSAKLGYNVLSLSGGEPLLYSDLRLLLDEAKAYDMITTITTNGMLLDRRRLDILSGRTDVLAISLDGPRDEHNKMRSCGRAFDMMVRRLEDVKNRGLVFGFIFTLTQYNVDQLNWAADFAVYHGASLLQIHPLEIVGRASETISDARPDERELAFGFLEVARLTKRVGGRLRIQFDVADRNLFLSDSNRIGAGEDDKDYAQRLFAESISPLVIEPDGVVVPLQYGMARSISLGNLYEASLRRMAEQWVARDGLTRLRQICRRAAAKLGEDAVLPFVNWYELVGRTADAAGRNALSGLGYNTQHAS